MLDQASQLKLQAWLDGELSPADQEIWDRRVTSDPQAQALVRELTNVNAALSTYESTIQVPASREFYWSGIERRIRQLEQQPALAEAHPWPLAGWFASLRRILVPAGARAGFLLAGWFAALQFGLGTQASTPFELHLAAPGNFTYRDFPNRTTLVWLSYPAEKEFADWDIDF